ncbi:hypothetical protein SLS53_006225 [Cytospora paraplurivora]|uniref:Short-chain dehydrogenase n=1 Tax=Cytospora paraplurivora TaxID=2898453 RepID=A0AAN9U412_9PEZI
MSHLPTNNTVITARESPGGPPAGLRLHAKLRWSKTHPPSDPTVSFAGKTVLVTGANTGLGFQAALKYVALGAEHLILAVRTANKGEDAKRRILELTGRTDPEALEVLTVDLDDMASVRAFVRNLESSTRTIDIALLNAGLGNPTYETSSAGWEMALQVNVLSTALLAVLLLPLLRATAEARNSPPHLTFVNSHGHNMVKREWICNGGSLLQTANKKEGWNTDRSYSMVKLLGMAVMLATARAAGDSAAVPSSSGGTPPIIVNAVCPDLCAGAASFGVILSAIFKVEPAMPLTLALMSFNATKASTSAFLSLLATHAPAWAADGWGGPIAAGTLALVTPILDVDAAEHSMREASTFVSAQGGSVSFTRQGSFYELYSTYFASDSPAVGFGSATVVSFRVLPKALHTSDAGRASIDAVFGAMLDAGVTPYVFQTAPALYAYDDGDPAQANAVHAAWRDSYWMVGT